jgi:hypothetical protein
VRSPGVAGVFLGEESQLEDVVAAVQWIAPWAMYEATDDIILAALDLADRLPAPTSALWQWWIACRYPHVVAPDEALASSGLSDELTRVLLWAANRGGGGLSELQRALEVGKDYFQALRELEREARDGYGTLLNFIDAIRRGDDDLGRVIGAIPGAYDNPAYRHARGQINLAMAERDAAVDAGMPLDLPPFRRTMLRFGDLPAVARDLAMQILGEVSGEEPFADAGVLLPLDAHMSVVEKLQVARDLAERGLPVDEAASDTPADWAAQLAAPLPVDLPGAGAATVTGLHGVVASGRSVEAWWGSLDRGYWGSELPAVFSHADQALTSAGLESVRLALWMTAEAELPHQVEQGLAQARRERRADGLGSLALQRLMDELNDVLTQAEEVCSW